MDLQRQLCNALIAKLQLYIRKALKQKFHFAICKNSDLQLTQNLQLKILKFRQISQS